MKSESNVPRGMPVAAATPALGWAGTAPRSPIRRAAACVLLSAAIVHAQNATTPVGTLGRTLQVPFDYTAPAAGTFPLYYELGRPFDPRKRTVIVVADGQQFYVRAGAVAGLQDAIFGDAFNVIGVVGRGTNDAVASRIRRSGAIDWPTAWRLLRSDQWLDDLERVRREIAGPTGQVSLYGRSGGGLLVHQYLARYPQRVRTAFTQAAVNRFVDARIGLSSDTFWSDMYEADPRLRTQLLEALKRRSAERRRIVLLLQRQNFFVPATAIHQERTALIRAIHDWNEAALDRYARSYQVDQVLALLETPNAAINVRLFELFAPVLASRSDDPSRLDPDIEVGLLFSAPLMEMLKDGRVEAPTMDLNALHGVTADVYLLAGRFDHTADYRSQIALASHYPNHRLLLLADDHNFAALQKTGLYAQLVQAALRGRNGPRESRVEEKLAKLVYREY